MLDANAPGDVPNRLVSCFKDDSALTVSAEFVHGPYVDCNRILSRSKETSQVALVSMEKWKPAVETPAMLILPHD